MKLNKIIKNLTSSKTSKQNGYAILFTVVVVSVISLMAIGLSNSSYKQIILSSLAKDSHLAFYQSDTAAECALYADNKLDMSIPPGLWSCGLDSNGNDYNLDVQPPDVSDPNTTLYYLKPDPIISTSNEPCFSIQITKDNVNFTSNIKGKGYNVCDVNNPRVLERLTEVDY